MTEKELFRQFKELRETKPRKDWVVLTKERILNQPMETEPKTGFVFWLPRLAFAPIVAVLLIAAGLFGFAQNTVPGDFLFPVKKITESAQVGFSSEVDKPKVHLQFANKRLEELSKIAEANQVKKLGPAIEAFQSSIDQATKGLAEMDINVTSSDPLVIKEIVEESQKLEEKKQEIETALGTIVGGTEELENAISQLEKRTAAFLIADLETRTLTEEDQTLLEEAKADFEAGNFSQALEKIWLLSNKK